MFRETDHVKEDFLRNVYKFEYPPPQGSPVVFLVVPVKNGVKYLGIFRSRNFWSQGTAPPPRQPRARGVPHPLAG